MKKENVLKSSLFHLDEGDILHLLFEQETGVPITITLNSISTGGVDNIEEVPDAPVAIAASDITSTSFTANWNYMENTLGFYLDVAEDSAFTTLVAGYSNLNVGLVNEYSVVGLDDTITYYYRLRGYNDYGTGISGNTITLTTANETIVDGDGNVYTYVTIGTQQWLVENLKTTKYIDGTAIPNLTLDADWIAEDGTPGHDGAYCWYDNDIANKADYGALYNWYAVDNAHGLAPAGWRVPTPADWNTLRTFLGGAAVAGGKLKEDGLTYWNAPNTGADNTSGFTMRGAAVRDAIVGSFGLLKGFAFLWTDTASSATHATNYYMSSVSASLFNNNDSKKYGFSVRLMRDVI